MREFIDRLTAKERTALTVLLGASILFAAVFVYGFLQERPAARRLTARMEEAQRMDRELSREWRRAEVEWTAWRQAAADLAELKADRLYSGETGYQDFRLDLQSLFDESGFMVNDLAFSYAQYAKDGLQRITASFEFSGTYAALKSFLDRVERRPRLLCVEKVDFLDIGGRPGTLDLRITMAGYHEK
jgi:cell division protein FtsL